jgi:hypothetical protein
VTAAAAAGAGSQLNVHWYLRVVDGLPGMGDDPVLHGGAHFGDVGVLGQVDAQQQQPTVPVAQVREGSDDPAQLLRLGLHGVGERASVQGGEPVAVIGGQVEGTDPVVRS